MSPRSMRQGGGHFQTPLDTSYFHQMRLAIPGKMPSATRTSPSFQETMSGNALFEPQRITLDDLDDALASLEGGWALQFDNANRVLALCEKIILPFFAQQRFNGVEGRRLIRAHGRRAFLMVNGKASQIGASVADEIQRLLDELREDANRADRWLELMLYGKLLPSVPQKQLFSERYGVILDIAQYLKNDDPEVRGASASLLLVYFSARETGARDRLAREIAPFLKERPTSTRSYSAERVYESLIPEDIRRELEDVAN